MEISAAISLRLLGVWSILANLLMFWKICLEILTLAYFFSMMCAAAVP